MKNSEGYFLFSVFIVVLFVLLGYLNNWMFVKDVWRLLLWLSQLLSNFINGI
jgi:hypothetical protein